MKSYKHIVLLSTLIGVQLLLGLQTLCAQVFAEVELNRKSVYVQQPFRVNITVYTKTWFTAPLEFSNLQIPNAFIVPFDKTQPGMFTVGGKQYPGVQFYYIVFPYKVGEFTVPSLEITAQSPPEGSSTARKVVLNTKEQSYTVRDVPANLKDKGEWFVAKGVLLKETWNPALKDLKVGDVVKRIITISAQGTLPQFIPDMTDQNADWASTYPQTPELNDNHGNGDVNGSSLQTTVYLLEKAGSFNVPAIQLSYWNPYTGKINTVSTQEHNIVVANNPNLGILTTLKDSLSATAQIKSTQKAEAKKPFLIWGMKWYQFIGLMLICIVILYFSIKKSIKLCRKLRTKWLAYRQSEVYLYRKFLRANGEPKRFLPALYHWWDSVRRKPSASIGASLQQMQLTNEEHDIKNYLSTVYKQGNGDSKGIKKMMKKIRHTTKTSE